MRMAGVHLRLRDGLDHLPGKFPSRNFRVSRNVTPSSALRICSTNSSGNSSLQNASLIQKFLCFSNFFEPRLAVPVF